ncbi:MAG: hypothetical protein ACJATT_005913 [Myxococcota bacterium]|jgi:hypothetical protein
MSIPPFSFAGNEANNHLYDQWEKGMTKWWESLMQNPAFLGSLGENMANMTQMRTAWDDAVDQGLERSRMPTRKDMIRLVSVVSLLEDKLLKVEDQLLTSQDRLVEMEKTLLTVRIESAEMRLELNERLGRMELLLERVHGSGESA